MRSLSTCLLAALALAAPLGAHASTSGGASANAPAPIAQPGELGGRGLALRAAKILTVPLEGRQFVDNGVVLVKDGKIEAVGSARDTAVPAGYEVVDLGDQWLMPGMIDLHSHIAGTFDINDSVYLTNPGLRASTAVRPQDRKMEMGLAGGVTTILFIPGSATNIGGQGILYKTGSADYESGTVRNPGSMKLAQAGNPERWTINPGRSFMNWNLRNTLVRGIAYAKHWEAWRNGKGPKPERNPQFEVIRSLYEKETQISTHTQIYQVVNETLTLVAEELHLPVYIDHGTFDGWRAAARAKSLGVNAIVGPREIDVPSYGFIRWSGSNPEKIGGCAAGYQEAGMDMVGFNTDAPVVPQEELQLQAGMGARYGFKTDRLQAVRGLTIVPAVTAGIQNRVGSIEPGKDADLLVITGDPADPRSSVERVYVDGQKVYDPSIQRRRW
ncbi:MAG: amidohydrolase family protein [Planctomycetes bacterium]|nr:amidohydrolase family protein [Planctomycetota bacterium]